MGRVLENTFEKGVITDCAVQAQPNNSMRDSMNGTIMDTEQGIYQWVPIKGNKVVVTFPETYYPVANFAFPDEIIVWLASDSLKSLIMSISFDEDWIPTYKNIYISSSLILTKNKPLRVFGYEENENIKRIYFSDRDDEPYVLNIKEFIPILDVAVMEPNRFYTVESGTIDRLDWENMVLDTYTVGDTFCFESPYYQFQYFNNPTVRPTQPLERLKWQPNAIPLRCRFVEKIAGTLLYGNYKLAYRYGSYSGFKSPMVFIGDYSVTKNGLAVHAYDQYQAASGDSHLRQSEMGFKFELTDYDAVYDYLELIAVHAINATDYENGLVVNTVELPKTGEALDLLFTNFSGSGNITIEEIMLNPIPLRSIGDMTVIKKHSVISNFKERVELPLPQTLSCTIKEKVYHLFGDRTGLPDYTSSYSALMASYKAQQGGDIVPYQHYRVVTGPLTYAGTTWQTGDVFLSTTLETVGATVRPVFARQTHLYGGEPVYEYIDLPDWLDYKDPVNASHASGFWGNTDVHLGILFYDKKMIPYFGRYLGKFHTSARNSGNTDDFGNTLELLKDIEINGQHAYSIQALSLIIDNLDLTDVIDIIGGYCICRVPSQSQIISEGWLEPIKYASLTEDDFHDRVPFLSTPWDHFNDDYPWKRRENWYFYVSPEFLFDLDNKVNFLESDKLRIERYQAGARLDIWDRTGADPYPGLITHSIGWSMGSYIQAHLYQKAYTEITPTGAVEIAEINQVVQSHKIGIDNKSELNFDSDLPGYFFKNTGCRLNDPIYPVGGKGVLLKTERDETGNDLDPAIGFGSFNNPNDFGITVVQQQRNTAEIGASMFDIEKLELIPITPIQIIDSTFKSEIAGDGGYIVDGIQVFGGGCYVNIFDYVRIMQNLYERDTEDQDQIKSTNHSDSIFIPLQSNINIALRKGKHVASVRCLDHTGRDEESNDYAVLNPNGISYNLASMGENGVPSMWEQFLCDDSYQNLGNEYRYPVLPANYIDQESFPSRLRYSPQKVNGETIDSFRRFLINNYIDLDAQNGPVTNIDGTYDKLFYWQHHAVGYIPIGERELVPSSIGAPIQLGIGGVMERSDKLDNYFGNQHVFGLLKIPNGYMWPDYLRGRMLYMAQSGALKDISTDNLFVQALKLNINGLQVFDNPFIDTGGISCGYDPELKTALFTFLRPDHDTAVTMGIHVDSMDYMGRYSFTPQMYINFNNARMFSVSGSMAPGVSQYDFDNFKKLYLHNEEKIGLIYDKYDWSWIDFIATTRQENVKFDVLQVICGNSFFDCIHYLYGFNGTGYANTEIENTTDERYYQMFGDFWKATFPVVSTGRISGISTLLRCILKPTVTNQKEVRLFKVKTLIREYKL